MSGPKYCHEPHGRFALGEGPCPLCRLVRATGGVHVPVEADGELVLAPRSALDAVPRGAAPHPGEGWHHTGRVEEVRSVTLGGQGHRLEFTFDEYVWSDPDGRLRVLRVQVFPG